MTAKLSGIPIMYFRDDLSELEQINSSLKAKVSISTGIVPLEVFPICTCI